MRKKKVGRPRLQFDLALIEKLATIHCTTAEMAAISGCSVAAFDMYLSKDKIFRETIEKARASGKASLRRMQYKAAQDGNATMMIWLGKMLLGQKEQFMFQGDRTQPIEVRVTNDANRIREILSVLSTCGVIPAIEAGTPAAGQTGNA